jgi:hypothetical protein
VRADDPAPSAPLRYGAYVCIPETGRLARLADDVQFLVERLGLVNEAAGGGDSSGPALAGAPSRASVSFLRRVAAKPGVIEDDGLLRAQAIVHVSAAKPEPVVELCQSLAQLLPYPLRVIDGAVLPTRYTSHLMHDYAYAHRVLQRPAAEAPNAFLLPLSKTESWWEMDWMRRHTYFLPRYDEVGRRISDGHVLAAEEGIAYLMRRTYRQSVEPAPPGVYDFVNYFECADEGIAHFEATCAALRDVRRNPEWIFVREGPTWQGRRVERWEDLCG